MDKSSGVLPDGRWFDPRQRTWRDRRGREACWPGLKALIRARTTRVVLAAAHLDHNPPNNRRRNLRALCQRCHLIHDRGPHRRQRWITWRRRYAIGDLFLGFYAELTRAIARHRPAGRGHLYERQGASADIPVFLLTGSVGH
jgi:hypothetical protein